jgi:hypothetical protein
MSKKTIFLILTLSLIIPSLVYSVAVTQTTAEQVAMNWYSERNDKAPNDFEIVESFIETENADNIYYIFNFDKTGFVIVSADDIAVPILGYVFKHNYTTENHPPQFDAMLASFREQILYARNNNLSPPQETIDKWNRLKVTTDMFVPENVRAVGPLLSTTWNQGQFYNESCPADAGSVPADPYTPGNGYVWAGCTATATAQVMKHHAHPATGEGTHSYTHATYGLQFVNFGATTYNWALMPNNVTAVTPSVHTLLYHVGVGAEMNYGLYGSGAWIGGAVPASALSALQNHFKYDLNSYYDQRDNYSATPLVWHAMLKTELDNNRPLVYEGYNSGHADGHAFVIDGYQGAANDDYHVNWGWSGSYDGYYTLDALAPLLPNYDYRFYQGALFGVEPRIWRPLPDVSIDVSLLPYTGVDLDHYYEGPVTLLNYSVLTDLSLEEFALAINTNNELVFTASPVVTSDVNINITIRATYTGGTADDTFNFIITGASSGSTVKWEQLPDLTEYGMDVTCSNNPMFGPPVVLADDFLCTTQGLITDIHVWGSWWQDILPEDMGSVIFHLSIHEDIPAGVLADWSMPGDILWERIFTAQEYNYELYNEGPEGWFDPHEQIYIPVGDSLCWLYNFYIDAAEAFMQEGTPDEPIVYWLQVQAEFLDPLAMFGWKTSDEHWNDDAVWVQDVAPFVGLWNELRYPPGHEYQGQSIDLAFQITTEEEEEELDFGDAPDPTYPTYLTIGARHIIDYQIFMGSSIDAELDGQPDAAATGDDLDGNDDEDGVVFLNPLYIGLLVNVDVTVSVDGFINAWIDFNINGGWAEVNDQIFTDVSVTAGTNTLSFTVPASATLGTTFARFRFNMQGGLTFTGLADDGEVEDYRVTIEEEVTYEYDFGDAPEGEMKIAYPSTGMLGYFPTCITAIPSGYVSHGPGPLSAFFGPTVDLEVDGNAGGCPNCFPTYDDDECYQDGDAGLIIPEPFTINTTNTVVPCTGFLGTPLGTICQTANWGVDIDIDVQNLSTIDLFVNVLFDWNQNGYWLDDSGTTCFGTMTPEHVLVNFVVPAGYTGPLSFLTPPSFVIGPNAGYFWSRFTISDLPVPAGEWDGSGEFAEGETEDYLILVEEEPIEYDFGDAPEGDGARAYPSLGVDGMFPTCITIGAASSYIQHGFGENWAWFGPMVDLETDGNAGNCPSCFSSYDDDECFQDGDAGLLFPDSYTIDASDTVIPCSGVTAGSSLGIICKNATWGVDIDIDVTNTMPVDGYVNVLFDWNQDGQWQNDATTMCAGVVTPEHVLVDFVVPSGHAGPLSNLMAAGSSFQIGPNFDYVWVRFSITEAKVDTTDWNGSGIFEDGESEDYLLYVEDEELDFGDAPDPLYPTLSANNGANHILDGVTFLGVSVDAEPDGLQDPNAMGDDLAGIDDEDGIVFNQIMTGSPAQVIVTVSAPGYLQGWMDFNIDGDWTDLNEQIFTDVYIHFAGTVCLNYYVPDSTSTGYTFARFRFSTIGGIGITGQAPDGEVEDYGVEIVEDHYVKWSQLPCEELPGLHCTDDVEIIADDWQCNGGLVTDIHWWGNYEYDFVGNGINYFHLSIHDDDPTGICLPVDTEIWGANVPFTSTNETNTGLTNSEGYIIYKYDHILSDPFIQTEGNFYWLDICAYSFTGDLVWRWQESSRSTAPILCSAAERTLLAPPWWQPIDWTTPDPTRYSDMAFEITSCPPSIPLNFTISKVGTNMTLSWDPDPCSIYYNVYSSTDPYATFPTGWTLEPTGTHITATTWNDPVSTAGSKKFYRVTAEN